MSCAEVREAVGAYVLGALDERETSVVREHLAACAGCAEEAERLAATVALLPLVPAEGYGTTPAGAAGLARLLEQVAAERRAARRRRWAGVGLVAAAAAAVAGVVVGALTGVLPGDGPARDLVAQPPAVSPTGPTSPTSSPDPAATVVSATDAKTGVSATVTVTPKGWGSALELQLSGVAGGQSCRLVAVASDGTRETAATWAVPVRGYGDGPGELRISGAVGIGAAAIDRFLVESLDGRLLVTVPA